MMLEVKDLKTYFPVRRGFFRGVAGWVKAVDGVSFEVDRAETLGLVGESGCGKTTVGKSVLRLLRPTAGRILFEGQDIGALGPKALHGYRKKMQMVFQDPFGSLNPRMTVSDIVTEGLVVMGQRRVRERLEQLLQIVGLSMEASSRYPHEFSGGQRQRIGIARALAVNPSFIVCDEPVSALDVSIQAQIINLLEDLKAKFSLSYLFVAHDLSLVRHIADRIAVMYAGKVMEEATTEELFGRPLHPYTLALFSSIPSLDPARRRGLKAIQGEPPSLLEPPEGCRFAGRCGSADGECAQGDIDFVSVSGNHRVRCVKYG